MVCCWKSWTIAIGLICTLLPATLTGQEDRPGDVEDDTQSRADLLQIEFDLLCREIEAELQQRLRKSEQELQELQEMKTELKSEFDEIANSKTTGQQDHRARGSQRKHEPSHTRLATIALYLGELERLVAARQTSSLQENRDLVRKLEAFFREHRELQTDIDVTRRKVELQRRLRDDGDGRRIANRVRQLRGTDDSHELLFDLTDQLSAINDDASRVNERPSLEDGAIQSLRKPLRCLLGLKWVGEKLSIDQAHWDELFGRKSQEQLSADFRSMLDQRGITVPPNDRIPFGGRDGWPFASNLQFLFQNLRRHVPRDGRFSSSGGGANSGRLSTRFVDAGFTCEESRFEFQIIEKQSPNRILFIRQGDSGELTVALLGDVLLRMNQESDGSFAVVEAYDDEVFQFRSDSFAALYREHPDYVENRLFPLLDHSGIVVPTIRFDEEVANRIVHRLEQSSNIDADEARQLIRDLDSDSFDRREAATRQLEANTDKYYSLLLDQITSDEFSAEALFRVKRILALHSSNTGHVDSLIAALGLMDDVSYLSQLLTKLDGAGKQLVVQQIEQLREP